MRCVAKRELESLVTAILEAERWDSPEGLVTVYFAGKKPKPLVAPVQVAT